MSTRELSHLDRILDTLANGLRTLAAKPSPGRISPAEATTESALSDTERKMSASLMRVNHTGEVCAQALYQGQALTARLPIVREEMEQAAAEELDHLAWCAERLNQLDSHASYLNPVFYAMSFGLGATAGLVSDQVSLGFVAATEDRVCDHLRDHQNRLPANDAKSRAIVDQMLIDEEKHGHAALNAGGMLFPASIKKAMSLMSKVMTFTTSRI